MPYPPTDGGAIAIYNTVTGAARAGHEVYLLSLNTPKHLQEGPVVPGLVYQEAIFVDTRFSFFKAVKNMEEYLPEGESFEAEYGMRLEKK